MIHWDNNCNPAHKYRPVGILILLLAALPAISFAQNDPKTVQTPASIFSEIKTQFIKDIRTVRDVAGKEGKEMAGRTKSEIANTRKTATGLKTRPDLSAPDTALSDH